MIASAETHQIIDKLFLNVQRRECAPHDIMIGTIALVSDVFSYAESLRAELEAVKAELQALREPVAIDGAEEDVAVLPNDGAEEAITETIQ